MKVEHPEMLKEWLSINLKKCTDADPAALGKYILALVKKDKKDLKIFLLETLEVFLQERTSKFVELLLEALQTKSYIKKTANVPMKLSSAITIPTVASSVTTNVKYPSDSTNKDILKDKKTKPTNDKDKSHSSSSENSGLHLKRKCVFDHSIEKESKLSKSTEREKSTPNLEVTYTPGVVHKSKLEDVEPSPKKIKQDSTPRGSDYRAVKIVDIQSNTIAPLTENVPKQKECPSYCTKPSSRCQDYDGFVAEPYNPEAPGFIAEPYNPEAPGMNMVSHLSFYNPSKPPPKLPSMVAKSSIRMQSVYFPKNDNYKPKQARIRELINVCDVTKPPAVDSSNKHVEKSENKDTHLKPLNSVAANHTYGHFKPTKKFDFSRLGGPCPSSLEIRKIPSKLNNVQNLSEHFSKFGKIVNIEIGADNDPESAKISFSSNIEAAAAYRSTDAILNNRFIKVFWSHGNSKEKKRMDTNYSNEINTKDISSSSPESLKDNSSPLNDGLLEEKINENVLLPKGNRSVYISAPQVVKKAFQIGATKKGTCDQREDIATYKIKLHQAKTQLVQKLVTQQKLILEKLVKTTKKSEKVILKKTLDSISTKIEEISSDLKKDNEALKSLLKPEKAAVPKFTPKSYLTAKELLDAELDLYKKQLTHSDEDTTELVQKAKDLGLLEHLHAPKSAYRRNKNSRSVDHRPKNILVAGKNATDKEDLKYHFMQFGDIEKVEDTSFGIVVSFFTRAEAEKAYYYGTKFEDSILSLSWINDLQLNATSDTPDSNEKPEQKTDEMIDVEEEEEEEEEEEARSWRR